MKKDEEREVPDPRESIEEIPTVNFPLVSSKSLQTLEIQYIVHEMKYIVHEMNYVVREMNYE